MQAARLYRPYDLRIEEEAIMDVTGGRGVDVAFEAAGALDTPDQAAAVVRAGGTVVIVGIPSRDELKLRHSVARRKGLTIKMSRRMKHTYPQTIALVREGGGDVRLMVAHRFRLDHRTRRICRTADQDALGGVLPATAEPEGYLAEKARGNIKVIPAQGEFHCELEAGVLSSDEAQQVEEKINQIIGD